MWRCCDCPLSPFICPPHTLNTQSHKSLAIWCLKTKCVLLKAFWPARLSSLFLPAKAEGRSCEYSGRIYQNGENFRAGCKHQCTCIDGAVGCVPLCPSHVPLASPSCPAPQLVKVPGQCCLSIDCHKGTTVVPPVYRRPQPPAFPPYPPFIPYPVYPYPKPFPKPYRKFYTYKHKKEKDTLGNELVEAVRKWGKPRGNKHLAGEELVTCCGVRLFPLHSKVSCLRFIHFSPLMHKRPRCEPSPRRPCMCFGIYVKLVFHWLLAHQRCSWSHSHTLLFHSTCLRHPAFPAL